MIYTYDPRKVLISLGSHVVTGYSDGTYISIEANGDGVTKKVGCDGEIVRSLDPDETAKLTLTLIQTSKTTQYVREMYKKDKTDGSGMFAVLIKDMKGGLLFSADKAWVIKQPSSEFAKEASDRTIELDCGVCTWGGESYPSV